MVVCREEWHAPEPSKYVLIHMTYRSKIQDLRLTSVRDWAPGALGHTGVQARGRWLTTVLTSGYMDSTYLRCALLVVERSEIRPTSPGALGL